jgi:hypothetical protein
MNDVPRRPGAAEREPGQREASGPDSAAGPERSTVDQTTLRPTERRFGEGVPTDGQNGQNSTPPRVTRPSDPGATPGVQEAIAPLGAEDVASRGRGAPRFDREDVDAGPRERRVTGE